LRIAGSPAMKTLTEWLIFCPGPRDVW